MSLSTEGAEAEEEGLGLMVGPFSSSRCSIVGASKPFEFAWILILPLRKLMALELYARKGEMAGSFEILVLEGAVEINVNIFPFFSKIEFKSFFSSEKDEECEVFKRLWIRSLS